MEAVEQPLGVFARLAFHGGGHERRGRTGDRTSVARELDIRNHVVFEMQRHQHLIPTQRIFPLRHTIRIDRGAEVPRLAVVVEYDGLIQLLQVGHARIGGRQRPLTPARP